VGKVLVIDTSVLCVWLGVPGKESCGKKDDMWDKERVEIKIKEEIGNDALFVLPLATIIETGNHIAQARHSRREVASELAELINKSADASTPWAAFSEQGKLWSKERLRELASAWPDLAMRGVSLGDATIKDVADYYSAMGREVEILTGDSGLKAYQPSPVSIPRRRS
jgi:hypothetical protein